MCSPCLPAEVWTLVFRHLSLSDRLRVRASCKYFRDLVDDSSVWRDWTVELRKRSGDEYEEDFWRMLRRWSVTSARLFSSHSLTQITKELPGLTTLIVNIWDSIDLRGFTNLERLHLYSNVSLDELSPVLPQRVTHLRLCQLAYHTPSLSAEIPPESPFKKLKCLVLHCMFDDDPHPVNVLHFFLSSLPQLQHLSLFASAETSFEGNISELPPLHNCSLSSLELVKCKIMKFPLDFMKMLNTLPFLQSLAIFCEYDYIADHDEFYVKEPEKLSAWLRDLPTLTSLAVACAHVVKCIRSIPSSVTRLILKPLYVDSWTDEMTALSAQLPNLRHLHLDASHVLRDPEMKPHHAYLRPERVHIPQLFPRLKTLRVRHDQVPEDALLSLASLKELEVLEMLDVKPPPAALISKLRELNKCRVRIYNRPESLWLMPCGCTSDIPTDFWA